MIVFPIVILVLKASFCVGLHWALLQHDLTLQEFVVNLVYQMNKNKIPIHLSFWKRLFNYRLSALFYRCQNIVCCMVRVVSLRMTGTIIFNVWSFRLSFWLGLVCLRAYNYQLSIVNESEKLYFDHQKNELYFLKDVH